MQTRTTTIAWTKRMTTLLVAMLLCGTTLYAQQGGTTPKKDWEKEGEIEDVEIEIINKREITLPKANRNFEKIPPRPAETIKNPITYDFRSFSFQAPPINPPVKPLKLKAENPTGVYGGYVRAGFGNYVSPLLEAYFNSRRDKNKLIGAHLYHNSSDKGPVDGRNSGSGSTGLSVFGKSFSNSIALSGNAGFENRTTHFYGYAPGTEVDAASIKQSYNLFKLGGEVSNAKNSDFAYSLGAVFSHMADKYKARETEVDLNFKSYYKLDEDSRIAIKADYFMISRKDALVEAKPRSLFQVSPSYEFLPIEDLKLSVGFVAAFENDSIDKKSTHIYPDVKATYPLSPSVDAVAYMTGGMEKVSLQSLSNENIWLGPNVPIFHTNKTFDFGAGIRAKVGNKVSAHAGLGFTTLKNWYFFVNTPTDVSKFTPVYDVSATKRTNFYAALSYAQSEKAKFMVRGDFYGYSTGKVTSAWHRPTYKLTANASINVYDKILFNADLIAQGGMKALDPVTDKSVSLKGAFDLNLKTEYLFSQSFSAFVQLNNITSSKYPLYLNYPVRGFQAMAGITWSF
ncbi:hypothetical protein [Chryseolinea lacunae]|uniref:TonB-dependent receptor n=1 Tax=Chryseolinea lacunae TaxID=2801331 RepID=A0ABS1KY04_9BACT|nr:hypothetical protein [Chryseolinea lacunae]MBL0744329.1 hypothetical protein [Chryseolinea lacunae]